MLGSIADNGSNHKMGRAAPLFAGLVVTPIAASIGTAIFILPEVLGNQSFADIMELAIFFLIGGSGFVLPECVFCLPALHVLLGRQTPIHWSLYGFGIGLASIPARIVLIAAFNGDLGSWVLFAAFFGPVLILYCLLCGLTGAISALVYRALVARIGRESKR